MAARLGGRPVWWVENFQVRSGRIMGALRCAGAGRVYGVCADGGQELELYEEDAFFSADAARRAALAELVGP